MPNVTGYDGSFGNLTQQSHAFGLAPVGTVMTFAGTFAPAGWLMCDGQLYLKTLYPALYHVIASNYGVVGGSFNVPDFRGRFIRGVAGANTGVYGTGNQGDPDAGSRGQSSVGSNSGNNPGSIQNDAFQAHLFGYNNGQIGPNGGPGGSATPNTTCYLTTANVNLNSSASGSGYSSKRDAVGSNGFNGSWGNDAVMYPVFWQGPPGNSRQPQLAIETRVINVSANYIIKY